MAQNAFVSSQILEIRFHDDELNSVFVFFFFCPNLELLISLVFNETVTEINKLRLKNNYFDIHNEGELIENKKLLEKSYVTYL